MADILKVTTPMVNRSQTLDVKKNVELQPQFNLQDVSKVMRAHGQSELLGQNTGMVEQEETSALLLNLLKDPAVAVNFLKNIFLMQEIIRLLPMNNRAFTEEISRMFEQLMVKPEDIAAEMQRQESSATVFKGDLFDLLRELLDQNPKQRGLQEAVVSFLKSLSGYSSRDKVLHSVANSLEYLSESLAPSKDLAGRLAALAGRFRGPDARDGFDALKRDVLQLFREIEDSILFSPRHAKVLSIMMYNMSRFAGSPDFLQESIGQLLGQIHGEEAKDIFLAQLTEYMQAADKGNPDMRSRVMETLTRILGQEVGNRELMLLNADKLDKIIHSLLSSPSNFTPLLHFVIPVQYEEIRSFAEIWINPNDGESGDDKEGQRPVHMLVAFEIAQIGQFELELMVKDKTIEMALFCPAAYAEAFSVIRQTLPQVVGPLGYRMGRMRVDAMVRQRSLMDVFKFLPYKRTGVDVKV